MVLFLLCLLILLSLFSHIGYLENKFIDGEDVFHVVQNPLIRNISLEGFIRDVTGFYRYGYPPFPVTYLWGLTFSIWGMNHIGFHFVSILLHILNVTLLFLLLFRKTRREGLAFLGALLYACHPIHCEAVNWISRQDILLFLLMGLLYLHLTFRVNSRLHRFLRGLCLLGATFIFPLAPLFVAGGYLLHDGELKSQLHFLEEGGLSLLAVSIIWARYLNTQILHTLFFRASASIPVLVTALFMPWKIHFLLPMFPLHVLGETLWILGLLVGCLILYLKRPTPFWGFIFLALLSIWLFHAHSSRFNGGWALPSLLWLSMGCATGLARFHAPQGKKAAAWVFVGLACFALFAGMDYKRVKAWGNTESLVTDSLKYSPADSLLWAVKGHYQAAMGNVSEMRKAFGHIHDDHASVLCLEAKAYRLVMQTDRSLRLFERLFHQHPKETKNKYCRFDFAVLKAQSGDFKNAAHDFKEILTLDPYFLFAWHDLGTLLIQLKKEGKGVQALQKALSIAPGYQPTLENLALYYTQKGDWKHALHYLQAAMETTSCHDTRKYYREWIKAADEKKSFPYAAYQWAKLTPPD